MASETPFDAYIERIERAQVYDVASETPLEPAPRLSARLGNNVLIKREDLQPIFSFKIRGAYNKISLLDEAQRACGVIAASAGNHAQGVAMASRRLGIRAVIVMPRTTPPIKTRAVRDLGAEVILEGDSYDDAYRLARKLEAERALVFVHPFDDPDVIAGQGTIGMELLRQHPGPLDAIFVPVGGGGLIAGIAVYVKQRCPGVKIIGVETDDAACMAGALAAGERVVLEHVGLFADGTAVAQVGAEPFRIAQHYVDEVITVDTDEVCAGIRDLFEETRSIAEPSGALAIAGLKKYVEREGIRDAHFVAIDSGANMNFDRLRHVAERAEIGEQREALYAVTIPERKGAFRDFCSQLGDHSVTEFNYRIGDVDEAHLFLGVALEGGADTRIAFQAHLEAAGLQIVDMSANEMAKLHIRFMVGGRAGRPDERLLRFEFPERPGALLRFLAAMGDRWNLSLFHYRNHGAAFGRVLAGIEVPETDASDFERFLTELGYAWWDERENPAYSLFLR
jgi:threonine dehydratase